MTLPTTSRNAVALLIGIGYPGRDRITPLRYAARDARALSRVLVDPNICAFPADKVAVLTDGQATRTDIVRHLSRWLPARAAGADLLLFYFAGHGVVERIGGREEGYLLPFDADADDVLTHGVPMSDVARWLEGLEVPNVMICLDCCHAGSILPREGVTLRADFRDMQIAPSILQKLGGRGRFLIASCDKGQKSLEADELRHGLFTYHLLRGLKSEGDRDGDGRVGAAELFNYVSAAVTRDAREKYQHEQTPWTSAVYNEDVILSTVRRRSSRTEGKSKPSGKSGDLSEQLRQVARKPEPGDIPLVFRSLAHEDEAVRQRAQKALKAFDWERVSAAAEEMARQNNADGLGALFDGLGALEAHARVTTLLDRLAGQLRGQARDRALWLLDRKRLALERERLAGVFREKSSPYEVLRVLGPGAYTGAYLARVELTGLEVVVRVLRPEFAAQPLIRSHFLELAGKSVRLVHQNLVLTREARAFADRDLYFTVRDYIPGATLREVLESGRRFEPLQVCKLLRQVLEALAPLHRDGMAHAGIKPSNIFISKEDRVLLGDPSLPLPTVGWDIPRLAYDFRYASPELFRGVPLAPPADLYSLGCVAHELFRGRPPFVADFHYELIAKHDRDPAPSLRANHEECLIDEWLQRLLAKSPTVRFATWEAALNALQALESALGGQASERAPTVCFPSLPVGSDSLSLAGALPPAPGSVRLMAEHSLAALADRQSIVPMHTTGGIPPTGPEALHANDGMPQGIPGYELLSILGRGGMGAVYQARQLSLNRIVALKILLSGRWAEAGERSRFRREAEAIARLQHPNIVQIFDLGEFEGRPFLALELCHGGSLQERIREQPLAPREAAELVGMLALGMEHVHRQGIVHRDLKPSNVLLTEEGMPKITDFGLAKRQDEEEGMTRVGEVLGTPGFMAPEQARGELSSIGPRTDVWGLGAILFAALTGKPPFQGRTPVDTMMAVMNADVPPPSRLNPAVPAELDRICVRCMQRSSVDRYPDAGALAAALRAYLDGHRSDTTRKGRTWWPFGRQ